MFFESRIAMPSVSLGYTPIAEAYAEGEILQALKLLRARGAPPEEPLDALLAADLLRAFGAWPAALNLLRRRSPSAPGCVPLQLELARLLQGAGRLLASLRLIDDLEGGALSESEAAIAGALRVCALAQMGRGTSAGEARAALGELEGLDPRARYLLGRARLALREWEPALEDLKAVARECPRWPGPRLGAYQALLILNRRDEARAVIEALFRAAPGEPQVTEAFLGLLYLTEDWERVASLVEAGLRGLDTEGELEDAVWARRLSLFGARAYWRLGDAGRALACARSVSESWAAKINGLDPAALRGRVEVEPIVQEKNMCVAACVAAILRSWGEEVDPRTIFKEMGGGQGVANWQLDRWLAGRRILPIDIQLDVDVIRELLDDDTPLLVTRSSLWTGHQELIIGYDDAFGELEVLDPSLGLPIHVPYEEVDEHYGSVGDTLVALVRAEAGSKVKVPARWCDSAARRRRRIERAAFGGDIEAARKLFAAVDPESPEGLVLRLRFPELFTGSTDFLALCERLVEQESLGAPQRMRALLSLLGCGDRARIDLAFAKLRGELGSFERSLYYLHRARAEGRWPRLRRWCELLLERAAPMGELWFLYYTALMACGAYDKAREALAVCLEIEPDHLEAGLASIEGAHRGFAERRATLAPLLARHPRAEMLRALDAQLDFDSGQPLEAELKLKETVRLLPASVPARLRLREYYLRQNRPDLAEEVPLPEAKDVEERALEAGGAAGQGVETLLREAINDGLLGKDSAALDVLARKRDEGRLTAEEELQVAGLQILVQRRGSGASRRALSRLLPERLPEPRAENVASLLGMLVDEGLEPFEAQGLSVWTRSVMAGAEWTSEARYLTTAIDELAGDTEGAEARYRELAEEGLGEAWHRLGLLAMGRRDVAAARQRFQRCIEERPSHVGAWISLFQLSAAEEDLGLAQTALERVVSLRPYDPKMADFLLRFQVGKNHARGRRAAADWLEKNGARYRKSFCQGWMVEIHLAAERYAKARSAIGAELEEDRPRDARALRLTCAEAEGRLKQAAGEVEAALVAFPDDPYFVFLKTRLMSKTDRAGQRRLVRRCFDANPNPGTLKQIFELWPNEAEGVLAELILAASEEKRGAMIAVITSTLMESQAPKPLQSILAAVEEKRPDDHAILERLIMLFALTGKPKRCRPRLRRYLDTEGSSAAALAYGGALMNRSAPELARSAFARHFNITRQPESLCAAARCDVALDRKGQAVTQLRAYLKKSQAEAPIVALLHELGEPPAKTRGLFVEVLKERPITPSSGFATAAVDVTLDGGEPLPPRWQRWAEARALRLLESQSQTPESQELMVLLSIWYEVTGQSARFSELYGRGGLPASLRSRRGQARAQRDRSWVARERSAAEAVTPIAPQASAIRAAAGSERRAAQRSRAPSRPSTWRSRSAGGGVAVAVVIAVGLGVLRLAAKAWRGAGRRGSSARTARAPMRPSPRPRSSAPPRRGARPQSPSAAARASWALPAVAAAALARPAAEQLAEGLYAGRPLEVWAEALVKGQGQDYEDAELALETLAREASPEVRRRAVEALIELARVDRPEFEGIERRRNARYCLADLTRDDASHAGLSFAALKENIERRLAREVKSWKGIEAWARAFADEGPEELEAQIKELMSTLERLR